jgi:hypothetical protein
MHGDYKSHVTWPTPSRFQAGRCHASLHIVRMGEATAWDHGEIRLRALTGNAMWSWFGNRSVKLPTSVPLTDIAACRDPVMRSLSYPNSVLSSFQKVWNFKISKYYSWDGQQLARRHYISRRMQEFILHNSYYWSPKELPSYDPETWTRSTSTAFANWIGPLATAHMHKARTDAAAMMHGETAKGIIDALRLRALDTSNAALLAPASRARLGPGSSEHRANEDTDGWSADHHSYACRLHTHRLIKNIYEWSAGHHTAMHASIGLLWNRPRASHIIHQQNDSLRARLNERNKSGARVQSFYKSCMCVPFFSCCM